MSISVEVRLLSGRTATVQAGLDEDIATLKLRAQTVLGVGKGRLADSAGSLLDTCGPIKDSSMRDGDSLTLQIIPVQVCGNSCAFAAILGDGCVVTWGCADSGGDSSAVQHQLLNVQEIYANEEAFAAILDDGSVVSWGVADRGGDSSAVQDQLKTVQ